MRKLDRGWGPSFMFKAFWQKRSGDLLKFVLHHLIVWLAQDCAHSCTSRRGPLLLGYRELERMRTRGSQRNWITHWGGPFFRRFCHSAEGFQKGWDERQARSQKEQRSKWWVTRFELEPRYT